MGLAARMPGVTDAMASPFGHGELALGRRWRLGRDISRRGYDQAVILPNSLKSALVPWFAGIARRTGFRGEMRWGVLNDIRALDRTSVPRLVDRFLLLADSAPSIPPMPQLRTDETRQRQLLERLRLDVSRPVAGLCPGAEFGPAKRWPPRHFAALAVQLIERGMRIWLLGSSRDAAIATEIEAQCPEAVVNLCGRTTLEDAVDLLAACSVVVSNDAWFGDSLAPHQHLQIAQMRALEAARPLVRATNTGLTAIVDERGRITAQAPAFVETVLDGDVQPRSGVTPYVRFGDGPAAGLAAVLLLAGALRRRG